MPFIEAPTTFYMGRRYDPATHRLTDDVVYYDSRDLTTHAVVLGMTGSGKTGLCMTLLEEAILDNLPAIIIDPKGDITNLLLNFPDMKPEDLLAWINEDDARRAGMTPETFAADTAQRWRDGLASWGIVPDRLRWLKQATDYRIYTPGSDTGLPISIMASLQAPREGWASDEEGNRERINGIVTALLALVGVDAKPLEDKQHVLIANIFEAAWRQGRDLTLEDIILQVQKPPFSKLGVFALDEYISEKDRYKLAMDLNNIIAAPSFRSWLDGEPLDIQNLLYTPQGRPSVSIFYIAHLRESERQFIITLLLENMLGWMRTLSGTTSLRALLYIDEMYGYFPPYPKNPPTKDPILRLLKQARAFGVGMVLATQNPADLDYKGLSNAGTWFIGRLQSEYDRQRVMAGLQGLATVENDMNMRDVNRLIAEIEPRVFLMHNVHNEGGPILFHTRWAMSFLRGPLTRQQVSTLMADKRSKLAPAQAAVIASGNLNAWAASAVATGNTPPPTYLPETPPSLPETEPAFDGDMTVSLSDTGPAAPRSRTSPLASSSNAPAGYIAEPPPIPSTIPQYFLPHTVDSQDALVRWERRTNFAAQSFGGATLAYQPLLVAQVTVRYSDRKTSSYTSRTFAFHVPDIDRAGIIRWDEYKAQPVDVKRVSGEPLAQAIYGEPAPGLVDKQRMTQIRRELVDLLYTTATLKLPYNKTLNIFGSADGQFSEFRARVTQAAREKRDAEIDTLTSKTETIMDRLEAERMKTIQKIENEQRELDAEKRNEMFTTGEAVLSLLKGRTAFTLSRMARAQVYRNRSKGELELYQHNIAAVDEKMVKAEQEFEAALQEINQRWAGIAQQVDEYVVTPYKKDILPELFGIGWVPYWYTIVNGQALLLPALV
jgi:hypothetical protein